MDSEELNTMLDEFKAKLREELSEEFNSKLNTVTDKFGDLLKKQLNSIHTVIKEQKEKIQQLEKKSRDKNLIIHDLGFDEENGLENMVLSLIREKFKVDIEKSEMDHITRIGKNKSNNSRPILFSLTTRRRKIEVIKSCKRLKGSKISITENYPEADKKGTHRGYDGCKRKGTLCYHQVRQTSRFRKAKRNEEA